MKKGQIRVIIADDHVMVRSGLRLFLLAFEDLKLVGEAANG
jgi:NarL family two-component system response regulator LiaR